MPRPGWFIRQAKKAEEQVKDLPAWKLKQAGLEQVVSAKSVDSTRAAESAEKGLSLK